MGDFSLLYKSSKVCYAVNEKKTVAAYPRKQERSINMAGYCSARKLTNVKGRIDYISNPKRQECIESYYSTADTDFWSLLAAECQQQHKQQVQKKIVFENGQETVKTTVSKCCEAREFIVGIPQDYKITAKEIAEWFKAKYGVECSVALHWKEKTQNFHAHIIYAERTLLKEPAIIEHKRTYYYDADGKKCKKADAVKVVPKGIETRYFSDKNKDFKTAKFALEFKKTILANFGLDDFDRNLHFATKHIGKNNPNAEHIRAYNNLVSNLNEYFDLYDEVNFDEETTPKQKYKAMLNKKSIETLKIDDMAKVFDDFRETYYITPKMAQNRFESLTEHQYEYEQDLKKVKTMYLPTSDVVQQSLNQIYKKEIPPRYDNLVGNELVQKIEQCINSIKEHIKWFVGALQKFSVSFGNERHKINNYDFDITDEL